MAENELRVGTKIDLSGLKKGLKEVEKELAQAEKEYNDMEGQYEKTMAKYQKVIDGGGKEGAKAQSDQAKYSAMMLKNLDAAEQKVDKYKAKLAEAKQHYADMTSLSGASGKLDSAMSDDKFVSGITSQKQYHSLLSQTNAEMRRMEAHAARISKETGISAKEILKVNVGYQKASQTANILKTRAKDINTNIKHAKEEAKGLGSATRNGIIGFGKMGLILMAVRGAMRAVSSATREYMAVNSELEGQINTLKALWGQVLGPVIEWVINLFIQAISVVNAFVYALTGINYVAKANAAALKKQGEAAKGNQTAGFDEQTKLADTSGSANPVQLLDSAIGKLNDFTEQLKSKILEGDWYGAGALIGDELMSGMESVEWSELGSKVGEFLSGAAALALGVVLNIDPLTVLSSAAEFVTGFIDGVNTTIQETDWSEVGGDIVEFVIKALIAALILSNPFATLMALIFTPEGQDLTEEASELIGSLLGGLLSAIVGAGEKIAEIATELWNGIKGWLDQYIDWDDTPGEIINGLLTGISDALKDIGTWLNDKVWIPFCTGFKKAFGISDDNKKSKSYGKNFIEGLLTGISDALKAIGTWLNDNVWVPFCKAFKKLFGINSPSTKAKTYGEYFIEGLLNGITGALKAIGTWLNENVWTPFCNGLKKAFGISDDNKKSKSYGKSFIEGLLTGITNVFSTIGTWLNDNVWVPFCNGLKKAFGISEDNKKSKSYGKSFIDGLLGGITDALTSIGTWITDNIWIPFCTAFKKAFGINSPSTKAKTYGGYFIDGLLNGITGALTSIGTWITDNIWVPIRDGIKKAFGIGSDKDKVKTKDFGTKLIDGIKDGITSAISKVKTACTTVWTTIKGCFSSVATWFKNTFSTAWSNVKNIFSTGGKIFDGIKTGISTTFKTIVNGLIDGINKIIKTPFNSINTMLNTIRSIKILGAQPFLNLWSYNPLTIPQIPKLALGGIVNRPGRGVPAIIGEAGAEAVLPLENNTEWMDILADKISAGNITIPITLDGKRIATYVVDIQKKKAFAMNGA